MLKSKDREKADRVYSRIVKDVDTRQFNMARAQLKRLEKMEGDTARVYDLRGTFAMIDSNFKEAEKFHKRAVELDGLTKRFRLNLGNLYMATRQWEKAVETFKTVVQKDPSYYPGINNVTMALFKVGKGDEALQYVEKMKKMRPMSPAPNRLEALYYYEKGQYEKALSAADKNIKLDPNNPLTFMIMGQIFNAMKKYDEAVIAFYKVLELNPKDLDSMLSLAIALGNVDRFAEARPLLETVVRNRPNEGVVHKALALVYSAEGRPDLAQAHIEKARQLGEKI